MKYALSLGLGLWLVVVSCGQRLTEEQLYAQAQAFEAKENFIDAVKSYEALVKGYPKGKYAAEAQYRIGLIYSNSLRDFAKAVAAYQQVAKKYPDSKFTVQSQFLIGFFYANELRDFDKAREAYTTFLQKYPNSDLADDVKWELDNLGKDPSQVIFPSASVSEKANATTLQKVGNPKSKN